VLLVCDNRPKLSTLYGILLIEFSPSPDLSIFRSSTAAISRSEDFGIPSNRKDSIGL